MRILILLFCLFFTFETQAQDIRIVSVGGGLTETIFTLDAGDKIVGVDTTSTYPEAVNQLPKLGYQRQLSAEGILALRPTHLVVTQEAGPATTIDQVHKAGVKIIRIQSSPNLADITKQIETLADLTGRQQQGKELIAQVTKEYKDLASIVDGQKRPKVLFLMSAGPGGMLAAGRNTAADTIISLAGGTNAITAYDGYKPLNAEANLIIEPEAIITTSQTVQMLGGLEPIVNMPGIAGTPAAQEKRFLIFDGQSLLGFSPRTSVTLKALFHQLHPTANLASQK